MEEQKRTPEPFCGMPVAAEMNPEGWQIVKSKDFRRGLDDVLQLLKMASHTAPSRERSLAITKIQEAIMWLGMDLKERHGGVSCYKHGYDNTPIVDQPTDVKL